MQATGYGPSEKGTLVVDSCSTDAVADDEHDKAAQDRAENYECRRAARER